MKKTYSLTTSFIGIDVASAELVINQYGQTQTTALPNNRKSIIAWLNRIPIEAVIAVEATGGYHELVLQLARATGRVCYLLNPKDVRHYAKSTGMRSKTDRVDAMLIARYIAKEHAHLHVWQPSSEEARRLDQLLTRRAKVVEMKGVMQRSLAGLRELKDKVGDVMEKLAELITQIDTEVEKAVSALPQGREHARRLQTIPGVGLLTSALLCNLFGRIPFTSVDAVIAFAGFDPRANDSGTKRGRRSLSKRGPSELRRLLYNAAMSGAKTKCWKPTYEHERAKGLPTTAALVVLARKILRTAFAIYKKQSNFDSSFIKIACAKP